MKVILFFSCSTFLLIILNGVATYVKGQEYQKIVATQTQVLGKVLVNDGMSPEVSQSITATMQSLHMTLRTDLDGAALCRLSIDVAIFSLIMCVVFFLGRQMKPKEDA